MLLRNLLTLENNSLTGIQIRDGKIIETGNSFVNSNNEPEVNFENAIAFPGLINSHDHLDFNLFPKLGNRKYQSYIEWGKDIHLNNKDAINKVLKVPLDLRVKWGIYKNLLNGVTTVVNHGSFLNAGNELITVFEKSNDLHSIKFQKNWKLKLNRPLIQKSPFVIHIGEGIDEASHDEIDRLIKWNIFKREIIGVHGIAMDQMQAKYFKGLVWCPDSNYFLIGETPQVNKLKHFVNIVFGTDSTLSASWNLWEHLRTVREKQFVTDRELFDMLTMKPAGLWQLKNCGKLDKGFYADLVIAKVKTGETKFDSFYELNPEDILMVMHKGNVRLFDIELFDSFVKAKVNVKDFTKVFIKNSCKYIYGDLPGLVSQIKTYYPEVTFPFETTGN